LPQDSVAGRSWRKGLFGGFNEETFRELMQGTDILGGGGWAQVASTWTNVGACAATAGERWAGTCASAVGGRGLGCEIEQIGDLLIAFILSEKEIGTALAQHSTALVRFCLLLFSNYLCTSYLFFAR
jgi:hypothetical protein